MRGKTPCLVDESTTRNVFFHCSFTFVLILQSRYRNVSSQAGVALWASISSFRDGGWGLGERQTELPAQRPVLRLQLPDFVLHLLDNAGEAAAALHDALFSPSPHRTAASIALVPFCGPARFARPNLGRDLVPERLCRLSPLVQLRGFG